MFLFVILGVDPAQNLEKYKRWLRVVIQVTIEALRLCNLCTVNEDKTKDMQVDLKPSNINLSLFVLLCNMYRAP